MPSINTITPLQGGCYFHIYNRGVNCNIFFMPENYFYFLSQWKKYLHSYTEVLAYCLLPNHFHFLIRIMDIVIDKEDPTIKISKEDEIGTFISEKLRRMFIAYSQSINRQESRKGSLFARNFKRKMIENDDHLRYLFFYIHNNPVKHGLTDDFRSYKFSSYQAYTSNKSTSIAKSLGLEFFDGIENFLHFHSYFHDEQEQLILD